MISRKRNRGLRILVYDKRGQDKPRSIQLNSEPTAPKRPYSDRNTTDERRTIFINLLTRMFKSININTLIGMPSLAFKSTPQLIAVALLPIANQVTVKIIIEIITMDKITLLLKIAIV